ncbi:MAG: type II secretion system F family protein [Planctomycetes bacterium]|nr:type II secretion system F family protein [Planctomycetota bacterium]
MSLDMVTFVVFGAVLLFAYIMIKLFTDAWQSYENNYLKGTARGLDAMFIALPPQMILYLSVLTCLFIALIVGLVFNSIVIGLIAGVGGLFAPRLVLKFMKSRRDRRFREQLSDALVGMGNSLKAGFSLFQAFELIQREMGPPISQEFRILVQELKFGMPMEEALQNLNKRMPSEDIDLVVSAITIAKDVGGNLTETFDNIAFTIRERQKMEGRIKALTSQGKMQGTLMCILPFLVALGVNYVNPTLMDPMFHTMAGWMLLGAVIVLELLGIYFIKKIITIDV